MIYLNLVRPEPFAGPDGFANSDDRLAETFRKYPEFGGYDVVFSDEEKAEYMLLVAKSYKGTKLKARGEKEREQRLQEMQSLLRGYLAAEVALTNEEADALVFKVQDVEHAFGGLQEWRYDLRAYLGDGITSLAIDETNNKLAIGHAADDSAGGSGQIDPSNLETKERMVKILRELGVPESAYSLEFSQPVTTSSVVKNLRTSKFSPPLAGIGWGKQANGGPSCTIGANVVYNGVSGFLTVSHCTEEMGKDPESRQRKAYMGSVHIGTESYDPPSISKCKTSKLQTAINCRYGDVVFMKYEVPSNRGRVVRTSESEPYTITVISSRASNGSVYDPFYNVSSTNPTVSRPQKGTILYNVGQTGGWKRAVVSETNVNIYIGVEGKSIDKFMLLGAFSVLASGASNGGIATCRGDSGGPWYSKNADETVTFHGI